MVDLNFNQVSEKIQQIELPDFDLVVAIARGGVVPGVLLAYKYHKELITIQLNYRDDANTPRYDTPMLLAARPNLPENVSTLLLVDDVSVSGKTLDTAKQLFDGYNIITFVLKGKADYVAFTDIAECVNWPWKSKQP